LTVLAADATTAHLVVEMGARGAGDIARLCAIARPHTAVVLNVGSAHLGQFGSRQAIAAAKSELVSGASEGAVLNADDPLVAAMSQLATGQVRTFGVRGDVRAERVELDAEGHPRFVLVAEQGRADVGLRLVGAHQVPNALAAATVALGYGLGIEQVAAALSAAVPRSRWRMEITERPDGVTVINDAYNANPESVRAALDALSVLSRGRGRRSWAVLGVMGELGAGADEAHHAIGRYASELDVGRLLVVGEGARPISAGASMGRGPAPQAAWVPDLNAAIEVLLRELRAGDVVLVKASRAAGLEQVAAAVLAAEPPHRGAGRSAVRDNPDVAHRNEQRR
jgi:UDP-N-acetylmuramoyl-tripeptide--D-alanyl-D-alanine ligase